jgi:hypothetical protein
VPAYPESGARPIFDLLSIFRGWFQKTCCSSATKTGGAFSGAALLKNSGPAPMSDKVEIFRARIVSLGLSHSAVDRILGKAGYTNKVMNGKKGLGAKVEADLCSALALKSEFVVDTDREAQMQAEWECERRKTESYRTYRDDTR